MYILSRLLVIMACFLPCNTKSSQAKVCRQYNLSEEHVSKWKRHLFENVMSLFEPADKQTHDATERIAELAQLIGRLPLALDIQKNLDLETGLNASEKREIVEVLQTDDSV